MTLLPRRAAPPARRCPAPARWRAGCAIAPAALLATAALLAGCGTVGQMAKVVASSAASAFDSHPGPAWMSWDGLLLQAAADANQNTPVALDIVFVRDLELLNTLQGWSAARWFAGRVDLQRTHPEGLQVYSVEVVPHQSLRLGERELGAPRVSGVLLYADYLSPGEHRQRLPRDTPGAVVNLGSQGFTVGPLRSNKP